MTHTHCMLLGMLLLTLALANVVDIRQADFEAGTYRITAPGYYRLVEDITFNPHPVGSLSEDGEVMDAYHPHVGDLFPSQRAEYGQGFVLGFFCAVMIAAPDVTLDLNGKTLQQSKEHALLQRFYANIELADRPFIPKQGPHDFGAPIRSAVNVVIKNGFIGLASHHGIHGNDNVNVTLENLTFTDFEVAAVALNHVVGLTVRACTATHNRQDIPVLAIWSHARFLRRYVDFLADTSSTFLTVAGTRLSAKDVQAALRTAVNNVHDCLITRGRTFLDPVEFPTEYALFRNDGLLDGNAYGFLVNSHGVAVNAFPHNVSSDAASLHVSFEDVHVSNIVARVPELVILGQGGKAAIDPVGAVWQLLNVHPDTASPLTMTSTDPAVATYTGNAVANAQALVAKAVLAGDFKDAPSFDVSRTAITADMIAWVEDGSVLADLLTHASWLCGGDCMFHVNKGVLGFKMDGAADVHMRRCGAHHLSNHGRERDTRCPPLPDGRAHPLGVVGAYLGADVRAFTVAGSRRVHLEDCYAAQCQAERGCAVGFSVMTDSDDVTLERCSVEALSASVSVALEDPTFTFTQPYCAGFETFGTTGRVRISNPDVGGLRASGAVMRVKADNAATSVNDFHKDPRAV
mmetsp:Transcript_23408/g.58543  ORF Transcript_23408/g.58543 Transcript_23408/m.58543 type:complete len:631 (-) Transcript_23408:10-1902(-)